MTFLEVGSGYLRPKDCLFDCSESVTKELGLFTRLELGLSSMAGVRINIVVGT